MIKSHTLIEDFEWFVVHVIGTIVDYVRARAHVFIVAKRVIIVISARSKFIVLLRHLV